MSDALSRLDAEGPAAPPRANGELCFDAPWQSRVFGMTMTLCDQGCLAWDDFRQRLIEEIGRWDRAHAGDPDRPGPEGGPNADYRYWEHWLTALTRSLGDRALLDPGQLADRERAFAERPPGHDHGHDHSHDHGHGHRHD